MSLANTKTKLTAALCMLLIAAVMMTTASYAWFTISTAPEITDLSSTVVTNETLEIALKKTSGAPAESTTSDSGNQYTWGNIIDLSAVNSYASLSKIVRPAKLYVKSGDTDANKANDNKLVYPKYGADGRISSLDGLLTVQECKATGHLGGFGNLIDGYGNVYGYYVDYYLRSNVGGTVSLSTAKNRGTTGETGLGSFIECADSELAGAMRVAFQVKGTGTITEATKTAGTAATTGNTRFNLTNTSIVKLDPDKSDWVRMYVYIDGDAIKNSGASIENGILTGAVNVQFEIAGTAAVDKPMQSLTESGQTSHNAADPS